MGSKDKIIEHVNKFIEILGDKECEFMKQLSVNFYLLEVRGGWCFSISQKKIILNPIEEKNIGKESPRTYITYDHTKSQDPGHLKKRTRRTGHEHTRQHWISLGMIREEDAHLLQNVQGPFHPRIERASEEYFTRKKEEEQRHLQDKASKYFANAWVWEKEKELR